MDGIPAVSESAARPVRLEAPPSPRLARMRFLSRLLDNAILLPGGYRIGLDPIIGLVPGVGDFLASTLSVWIIYDAARLGVQKRWLALMAGNVLLETIAGAVPVVGDLFDAAWKANARNMTLVEKHYRPGLRARSFGSLALVFLVALLALYGILFGALYLVWRFFTAMLQAVT